MCAATRSQVSDGDVDPSNVQRCIRLPTVIPQFAFTVSCRFQTLKSLEQGVSLLVASLKNGAVISLLIVFFPAETGLSFAGRQPKSWKPSAENLARAIIFCPAVSSVYQYRENRETLFS